MLESLNAGKTIADSLGDMQGRPTPCTYLGLDRQGRGTHAARTRQLPHLYPASAKRGGRSDYPLELPALDAGLETRTGYRLWQYGCPQTGRANTADRLAPGRTGHGGWLPPGILNIVNGVGEVTGATVVVHPDVDKIVFTGHVDTAKIIQKAAADTLKRTSFELGGKSPNVIFADADMDQTVADAFHAIYFDTTGYDLERWTPSTEHGIDTAHRGTAI